MGRNRAQRNSLWARFDSHRLSRPHIVIGSDFRLHRRSQYGGSMPTFRSRPAKLNHADTILYEIYMLRFTARRLVREKWEESEDAWVYLEAFLVHYRNLIEFLGKKSNVRDTDLHVTTIWVLLNVPPPRDVDQLHAAGEALWKEYEEVEDRISRF